MKKSAAQPCIIIPATLVLAAILLFIAGCRSEGRDNSGAIVVTDVFEFAGESVIVTRVIQPTPTPTVTPQPPAEVDRLVELDLAFVGELPNLDPQQVGGATAADLTENLFVGLTNFNHETRVIEPELARAWRVTDNGRTWTFSLRDDIFWIRPDNPPDSPGELWTVDPVRPVTAEDVVTAVRRACSASPATPDQFILYIIEGCQALAAVREPADADLERVGVRAVDETTVVFTLNEPSAYFLTMTSLSVFHPVPAELIEEFGDRYRLENGDLADGWQTPGNLITSGPFFPAPDAMDDSRIIMWRNPLWPLETRGNAERINIRFLANEMALYDAWQEKQLDIAPLPPEVRPEFLERSPAKALLVSDPTVFYLGINVNGAAFSSPEVRRAFSAAINREELMDALFDGRGVAMRHFTPPDVFGAPPVDQVGVGYSPDFALQQMDRSSFRDCALLPDIRVLVSTADLSLLQLETIRDMWVEELGCREEQISIEQEQLGNLLAATRPDGGDARPDLWELAHIPYFPDAHDYLTRQLHCTDSENRAGRSCSEVDTLMQRAAITPDPQERIDLYREIERSFFAEDGSMPLIPLYVRGDYVIVQSWLDFVPASTGGEQFDTYLIDVELKRLERSRS